MPLEEVEPLRPAESPVLYGGDTSRGDLARSPASNESPTSAGDVTDAEREAYINRPSLMPSRRGCDSAAYRDPDNT